MKILNFIKNDSLSISPQTNRQPSLIEKIKSLISNLFSFIRNYASCESVISKQVTTPLNLSHEILRVLDEEKSAQGSKKDLDLITFFFHETISDITKDTSTSKSIYDVPKNNKPVLEELNYEEIYEPTYDIPSNKPIYDTPTSNRPIREEPIYEEINKLLYKDVSTNKSIYDVPKNNKPVLEELNYEELYGPTYDIPSNKPIYDSPTSNRPIREEPIYEEIDDSCYRVDNRKIINDTPPPLPPRNW